MVLLCNNGQIYGGDFTKFCGLLRIYDLYQRLFEGGYASILVKVLLGQEWVCGWVVSALPLPHPPPSSEGPEQSAVDWSEGGSVFITTTTNRDSSHNYLHTAAPWGEIIPIFIPLGFHGIFLKFCKGSDKYLP